MQKLLNWLKLNPAFIFLGAMVLLVVLVISFFPKGKTTDNLKSKNQLQHESQTQTQTQTELNEGQWKYIDFYEHMPLLVNNYARCVGLKENNIQTSALSGSIINDGFIIQAINWRKSGNISPNDSPSTVAIPIPADITGLSFTVSQERPDADMTKYAYGTKLEIMVDGEVIQDLIITKINLLTRDIPIQVQNGKQVTIRISTLGQRDGDYGARDQYGPWFPLVVSDFKIAKIQQEEVK